MAALWMTDVDPKATDEEIRDFLVKYGFPPYDAIQHMPGDGSHPAVLASFKDEPAEALRMLATRINDMFWRIHKIQVHVMELADEVPSDQPKT